MLSWLSRFCDLDLDPMTLIYELDVDSLKTHTKNQVSSSMLPKVVDRTEQTDRQTDATNALIAAFVGGHDRAINKANPTK